MTVKKRDRASIFCFRGKEVLLCNMVDPVSQNAFFAPPGGGIEKGEHARDCAKRECLEETGYHVLLLEQVEFTLHYPFYWAGSDYHCTTQYFLATLDESKKKQKVDDADYITGHEWIHIDEAIARSKDLSEINIHQSLLLAKQTRNIFVA